MSVGSEKLRARVRDSIVLRPIGFVLVGAVVAAATLAVDAAVTAERIPTWLHWTPGSARFLYATLAGAILTFAGLTFLVRSTIVSLAASQYSARVVVGFLQDWYQQSMMSLMLGIFAYAVVVLRALPDPDPGVSALEVPQLSVLVGILATAAAVMVVMAAIRRAVRSMYAGALASATTEVTVDRIRALYPLLDAGVEPAASATAHPPARAGVRVRSSKRGWVQHIDEDRLLELMPPGAFLQVEVRVGLYVIDGRPVATVWSDEPERLDLESFVAAVEVGRTRLHTSDVETAMQTLVDIAVGSLETGAADVAAAYEVIQHIEIVLHELARRRLPKRVRRGEDGRVLVRDRTWSFADHVGTAFDRLRRAGAAYPPVVAGLLNAAGELALDLDAAGLSGRAAIVRRELEQVLATAAAADLVEHDLAQLRELARRYGAASDGVSG